MFRSPGVKVTSLPVLPALLSLAGKLIHMWLNGPQATHKQTLCVCLALQLPYLKATVGSGLPVEQIPNEDVILIHSHKALSALLSVFLYRLSFCFTPALPSWHPLLPGYIKLPEHTPNTPRPVRQRICYMLILLPPAGEWNTQDPMCMITANIASLLQHD